MQGPSYSSLTFVRAARPDEITDINGILRTLVKEEKALPLDPVREATIGRHYMAIGRFGKALNHFRKIDRRPYRATLIGFLYMHWARETQDPVLSAQRFAQSRRFLGQVHPSAPEYAAALALSRLLPRMTNIRRIPITPGPPQP